MNAALRVCSTQDSIVLGDKENIWESGLDALGGTINNKMYKCKSLDVSLDDIDCNQHQSTPAESTQTVSTEQWLMSPITPTDEPDSKKLIDDSIGLTSKFTNDPLGDNDNGYIKHAQPLMPVHSSRSKSLPHSMANSFDCLTNEAYEDDEELIISKNQSDEEDEVDNDELDSQMVSAKWVDLEHPKSYTNTSLKHSKTTATSSLTCGDKDFITKL